MRIDRLEMARSGNLAKMYPAAGTPGVTARNFDRHYVILHAVQQPLPHFHRQPRGGRSMTIPLRHLLRTAAQKIVYYTIAQPHLPGALQIRDARQRYHPAEFVNFFIAQPQRQLPTRGKANDYRAPRIDALAQPRQQARG